MTLLLRALFIGITNKIKVLRRPIEPTTDSSHSTV